MTVLSPIRWPSTLPIDVPMFQIENMSRGGGPSLSGKEQIVSSASGRWIAKFSLFLGTRAEHQCYRAMMAWLEGRSNTILVSPSEPSWSPAVVAGSTAEVTTTYSDGSTFSDGTKFEQDGVLSYLIQSQNPLDTSMLIYCSPVPQVGAFFSLTPSFSDYSELHLIKTISALSGGPWSSGFSSGFGPSGTLFTITVEPPLHQSLSAGSRLSFGRPLCRMRLASDTAGALERSKVKQSEPQLQLVEVF